MEKVRAGIVGCGTVAGYGYLPAINESRLLELVAVAGKNYERARAAGERYGVDYYLSQEELLAREDIDAVVVATPTFTHAEIAVKAFEAGKHVFCEKPIAMSLAEARAMLEASRRIGRILMVGFVRRFMENFKVIKEVVSSGDIGDIKYIRQASKWREPMWAGRERYEWMINRGGGRHRGDGFRHARPHRVELDIAVPENVLEVAGTRGVLVARGGEIVVKTSDYERKLKAAASKGFREELEEFAKAILEGAAASRYRRGWV